MNSKAYDGLLLINKPSGMTSHDVVAKIRRWMNFKAVGHAGTLDPVATGLMVLLVGKGTKISDYILNGDKAYNVKVQLGLQTDTDDITGEVVREEVVHFEEKSIVSAAESLQGPLDLAVPIYSAVKQKGKKLYQKARAKEDFKPPVRTMTFSSVRVLEGGSHWVSAHLRCTKGSYIRSWARALGEKLGVGAVVGALHRTNSEPYSVENAVELDTLISGDFGGESQLEELARLGSWIPLSKALPQWPAVKIDGVEEKLVSNGQIPRRLERFLEIQYGGKATFVPGVKIISRRSGNLLSLLSQEGPLKFKIRRVFPRT